MINKALLTGILPLLLISLGNLHAEYLLSKPGKLLLQEDFGQTALPELFTVGVGDWKVVDGALRGRELSESKHTAFRKIFLDHQDVIYEYDMKLEGQAFHQLLINWDLVHIAKGVIRHDSAGTYKILEKKKREQMAREGRDQGRDPLKGDWNEPTMALEELPVDLEEGRWYHVIIEVVGDRMCMQVDGQVMQGRHTGLTEKKDNFGFQAGGLDGYLYIDNVRVREALPAGKRG